MRSCVVLLFASLLTLCEAQGTFVTPVFVPKGRDLLLELHADPPEGVLFVNWKINKTVTLVRFDPSGKPTVIHNVTGRVQLGEIKFSVRLKNVQEVDSGVYSAVVETLKEKKTAAEYKVTVEDCPSHRGLVIAVCVLVVVPVIVVVLSVWLCIDRRCRIRLIQRCRAALRLGQALNDNSAL